MTEDALNPIPFWFLRHGETDWNARGLSQGNVDIPLNAVGIEQARRAALTLLDKGIATIIASPLGRTRHTAELVAEALKLPVAIEEGLREVSFGVQEGKPMAGWFEDWIEGRMTPEGGESFVALRARAVAAINRCTAQPGPVLVVAHGALWRAFRSAAGLPANVRTPNGLPMLVSPPEAGGTAWSLSPAELAPAG